MNRFAFFILLLGMGVGLIAQENAAGISFQQGEFQAMLDKAKAENKLIFMDVYTTWCGPCKMLDRNTFSDAQVGNRFNAEFINYKLDAEKGEGISIARKYAVRAYPNMLFINGQGELVHRVVGYRPPEELLKERETALQVAATMRPLSWFDENYAAKKTDKGFMQAYVTQLKIMGKDNTKILGEYLKLLTPEERVSEDAVKIAADNLTQLEGPAYELLASIMRDAGKHSRAVLQSAYSGLFQVKSSTFQKAVLTKDRKLLDKLIQVSKETDGPSAPAQIEAYEMEYAKATGDLNMFRKSSEQKAAQLMAKKKADLNQEALEDYALELNNLAWAYVETMKDPADLNKALAWSARSLELNKDPNHMDTYANLLFKLGKKEEAIKIETEAMEMAKPEQKEIFMDTLEKMKNGN